MGAEITIFQHYLPQTWLKWFTYNKNKSSLYVYDTEVHQELGSKNINSIAGEDYFYDFHPKVFSELVSNKLINPTKEIQFVEKQFFSYNIENKLGILLKEINRKLSNSRLNKKVLNVQDKLNLTIHFSIQFYRGILIRKYTMEILKIIEEISYEDEKYKDFKITAEEEVQIMHFLLMNQSEAIINFAIEIFKRPWVIFKAQSNKEFIISDNPFSINVHDGLKDICIPISKEFLFVMYNKNLDSIFDLTFTELKDEYRFNTIYFNRLQYQESYKQIYSSESDFSWVDRNLENKIIEGDFNSKSKLELKKKILSIMERKIGL